MKTKRVYFCLALIGLVAIFVAYYKYLYPFGYRPCRFSCIHTALYNYALDHDGEFPAAPSDGSVESSLESLALMYPKYLEYEAHYAGLSGDERKIEECLKSNSTRENCSSWIYKPGLNVSNNPPVAILWDRKPGIGMNGKRIGDGDRVVGFSDGTHSVVSKEDWQDFVLSQEKFWNGKSAVSLEKER